MFLLLFDTMYFILKGAAKAKEGKTNFFIYFVVCWIKLFFSHPELGFKKNPLRLFWVCETPTTAKLQLQQTPSSQRSCCWRKQLTKPTWQPHMNKNTLRTKGWKILVISWLGGPEKGVMCWRCPPDSGGFLSPTWTMVLLKLHWDVTEATLSALAAMVRGGRGGGSPTRFTEPPASSDAQTHEQPDLLVSRKICRLQTR